MVGLNLCCGTRPIPGFLNVDKIDVEKRFPEKFINCAFLCYDLNQRPWPWGNEEFDYVIMRDGLEHLQAGSFIEVMSEVWRILKPNGEFACQVPNAANYNAFTDPTHQMFFTDRSFDYLDPSTVIGTLLPHYIDYKFKILKVEMPDTGTLKFHIRKIMP